MASTKRPVQKKYDRLARVYDRRWAGYIRLTLDHLAETLPLGGNEAVLDVPCGTGELMRRLVEDHPELPITGLDVSEEMLNRAREKLSEYPSARLRRGRAEKLPFKDDRFDLVVSASSFHYFDPPEVALQEFRRVLRPGGRLVVMDWDRMHSLWKFLDPLFRWLDPAYTRCYAPSEIKTRIRKEGFAEVSVESLRLGRIWGLWIANAVAPRVNQTNPN